MVHNPHDALVKSVLAHPEHARGVLQSVVPTPLVEALDWTELTLRPGNYVDVALREQFTDLLYSATWRGGDEVFVYFLFEHQSSPPTAPNDGLMAYRLLRYQVQIWERWRADHPVERKLPMILPVVMYHGATPWPEPVAFDALIAVPPSMRPTVEPHLVRFAYVLHDLSRVSDDELHRGAQLTALAKLVTLLLKHGRTRADLLQILGRWADVMREVVRAPNGLEALARVVRYILEVNEHVRPEALQALLESEIGPEAKDTIVTAAQQYIEQGIEQGIERGRQQGESAVLLRLVRQRFGDEVDPQVERRIATASIAQLNTWTARIFSAATLTELLAD
jgi:predicted transposase/invertase (TIGR01784 family)